MNATRRAALVAGLLYITGTVMGIASVVALGPVMDADNHLAEVAADEDRVILGALFVLAMGLSLSAMSVVLYPVLRRFNPTLATGYVVFRGALEGAGFYLVAVLATLFLVPLSEAYRAAGSPEDGQFQALAEVLVESREVGAVGTIVFILGAVMFYWVLWESRLVPRWLSGWGLLAAVPYIGVAFLVLFGAVDYPSDAATLPQIPLAIQEMVLALWLVVYGFNRDVTKNER